MSGYNVESISIDGNSTRDGFISSLLDGTERYIHISSHGGENGFYIHGKRNAPVAIKHISTHCGVKKPLKHRFLTVSACGDPNLFFWKEFNKITGVSAVISPMGKVNFSDSAMFFASFYFALLRHPRSSINSVTSDRLIDFIDTFQRTKGAHLTLGGNGAFRLCFWHNNDFKEII